MKKEKKGNFRVNIAAGSHVTSHMTYQPHYTTTSNVSYFSSRTLTRIMSRICACYDSTRFGAILGNKLQDLGASHFR
jgi:hypothetical protein